jgi:cytochrome c553
MLAMKPTAALAAFFLSVTVVAPAGAADATAGAAKAESCAACHGPGGLATMAGTPSLAGQPEPFLQWQLVYFRTGTRKSALMQPVAAALSDDDIRNLAAHFAAQKPPARGVNGAPDAAMFGVGQRIAQANRCASCHKDDFSGDKAVARIAGQREDYLLKSLRDYKSGARAGGGVAAMPDAMYRLGDDELRALAHYVSHL